MKIYLTKQEFDNSCIHVSLCKRREDVHPMVSHVPNAFWNAVET